jgi:hypothetical protein
LRSRFWNRLPVTAFAACGALLLLPASGSAAQVFGSGFVNEPNEQACQNLVGPCTVAALVEHRAEGAPLTSAGSPIDGVLTSFRVRAVVPQPTQAKLRVASVSLAGPGEALATITGDGSLEPTVTLQVADAESPPQQFPARLPVSRGQHLALEGDHLVVIYNPNGDDLSYAFAPPLVPGLATKSNEPQGELLVQATVEPDADGDGFGDETQDKCPAQKTEGTPCDLDKPGISGLRVRKGKAFYRLSELATVSFVLEKKAGRRFKPFGRPFLGTGNLGPNKRKLPAKPKLKPGVYRLKMAATDAVKNIATAATRFTILKRRGSAAR